MMASRFETMKASSTGKCCLHTAPEAMCRSPALAVLSFPTIPAVIGRRVLARIDYRSRGVLRTWPSRQRASNLSSAAVETKGDALRPFGDGVPTRWSARQCGDAVRAHVNASAPATSRVHVLHRAEPLQEGALHEEEEEDDGQGGHDGGGHQVMPLGAALLALV